MKSTVTSTQWSRVSADAIVFLVSEDNWKKEIAELNAHFKGELSSYMTHDNFKAHQGRMYAFPTRGAAEAKTILLAGVGKANKFNIGSLQEVAAQVAKYARFTKKKHMALSLSGSLLKDISPFDLAKYSTEGFLLGGYKFSKYKTDRKEQHVLESVTYVAPDSDHTAVADGIGEGTHYADATNYTRDLVNEPPTVTTPTYLAEQAKRLASSEITVEVLDRAEVKKMGMDAYLSVARGSDEPPKFIKLTYIGGSRKVVIAGKGITFDSGGLSLKDARNMETMKLDMAGAAAVLGVFSVLAKLKPNVTVVGIIAACENMLGPNGTKPGDIVKAYSGKTIEILNTDAEGRLTLADVLAYAVKEKPEVIVDLATLTGACIVALGEEIAGLFTNSNKLAQNLKESGKAEGEKLWQLPLEEDYKDLIRSDIADLRNIARNRYGGAVTAALFLEEFVEKVPWAHLDIAGPAFEERETPLVPRGASGFGVRTLLKWLKSFE